MKMLRAILAAPTVLGLIALPASAQSDLEKIGSALTPDLLEGKINVRLDPALENLLVALTNFLPKDRADVFIAKMNDLLKGDFYEFTAGAKQLIDHELLTLECVALSTEDGAIQKLKEQAWGADTPNKILDLRLKKEKLVASFKADEVPKVISAKYADMAQNANDLSCHPKYQGPAEEEIARIKIETANAWRLWFSLGDRCTEPSPCVRMRQAEISALIETADKRDVDASGVRKPLADLKVPPDPGWALFGNDFHITAFEKPLAELATIETALNSAKTDRLARAKAKAEEARKPFQAAQIQAARIIHGPPAAALMFQEGGRHDLINDFSNAAKNIEAGKKFLDEAKELAGSDQEVLDEITKLEKETSELFEKATVPHQQLCALTDDC